LFPCTLIDLKLVIFGLLSIRSASQVSQAHVLPNYRDVPSLALRCRYQSSACNLKPSEPLRRCSCCGEVDSVTKSQRSDSKSNGSASREISLAAVRLGPHCHQRRALSQRRHSLIRGKEGHSFSGSRQHPRTTPAGPLLQRLFQSTPVVHLGNEDRLAFFAWRCGCVRTQISSQRLPHCPRHLSSLVSSSITPPHSGQMQFRIADLTSSAWVVRVSNILLLVLRRVP